MPLKFKKEYDDPIADNPGLCNIIKGNWPGCYETPYIYHAPPPSYVVPAIPKSSEPVYANMEHDDASAPGAMAHDDFVPEA